MPRSSASLPGSLLDDQRAVIKEAIERQRVLDEVTQELRRIQDKLLEIAPKVALLEAREAMAHQILNEWDAPTHDSEGRKLNNNGRMEDLLWRLKEENDYLRHQLEGNEV